MVVSPQAAALSLWLFLGVATAAAELNLQRDLVIAVPSCVAYLDFVHATRFAAQLLCAHTGSMDFLCSTAVSFGHATLMQAVPAWHPHLHHSGGCGRS